MGSFAVSTLAGAQEPPNVLTPGKSQALAWAEQLAGRHYYLKELRDTLLINDQVDVVRCVIRYKPDTNPNTGVTKDFYSAKLWFEGISPAPQVEFRMTVEDMTSLE